NWWEIPAKKKDNGRKRIPHLSDPNIEYINFAKRAILSADAISTVSEQHREEIITKHYGQDLHRILKNRQNKLFGIVNGISYNAFNPMKDPGLHKNYNHRSIKRKKLNKKFLQRMFKLPEDEKIPLMGMVMRVSYQKGFNLLFDALGGIMKLNVQLVVMGGADKHYRDEVNKYIKKYPKKINAHLKFNTKDATKVYSGSDMFLMPSHMEPCGITQLIAMRYGSIPVVRHVGGLIDTVSDYNPETKKGNGFVFKEFDSREFLIAITRAVENFKSRKEWRDLAVRVMQESNSWEIPAKKYVDLYYKIIKMNGKK
ncbi:glycogen synthase, partial [Candidatus Parcubacteria bacterium]|nr:glycogen synthase [Candidatus Parcubacteria bacterium]